MLNLNTALSALQAQQRAIQTTSNNIANATSEGYVRETTVLSERKPLQLAGQWYGSGVEVSSVQRMIDQGVNISLSQQTSLGASAQAQLDIVSRIESLLQPGTGSLGTLATELFNAASELAQRPTESALADQFVSLAQAFSEELNQTFDGLAQLQYELATGVSQSVDSINSTTQKLSELNATIKMSSTSGSVPNALLSQRELLLSELAKQVDVDGNALLSTDGPIIAGGGGVLVGQLSTTLDVETASDGTVQVVSQFGNVVPRSGQLAGLLTAQNQIASYRDQLQSWASELVGLFDQVQATGLGGLGPQGSLTSERTVTDVDAPLSSAGLDFPIQNGQLSLSVTDVATGERTVHQILVDPETDSLRDLATQLDAVPGVRAMVNSQTGKLSIVSDTGFLIDFANRLPTVPNLDIYTGTSIPDLQGQYTGTENQTWRAEVIGGGTIGRDASVVVQFTNAATGDVISTVNLGDTYGVNSPIQIANGVSIACPPGSLVAGDEFSFDVVANSDTSGALTALGLGTLFAGSPGQGLQVRSDILNDSRRLQLGLSGTTGDGTGFARLATLKSADGTQTLKSRIDATIDQLVTQTGIDVQRLQIRREAIGLQEQDLQSRKDSVSGVDPNEEMLKLLEYQRGFQAASRLVTTINDAFDQLFLILR